MAKRAVRTDALRARLNPRLRAAFRQFGMKPADLRTDAAGAKALRSFHAALDRGEEDGARAALRRVLLAAAALTIQPDFLKRRLNQMDARVAQVARRLPADERAAFKERYLGLYARVNGASGLDALRKTAQVIDRFLAEVQRREASL